VTQTPTDVAQTPPAATQTPGTVSVGPEAPTGPLRLVLPTASGDGAPARVVQVSASSADAGRAPAVALQLHAAGDTASAPNLPSGALLQFNVAALGGVRAPDQLTLLTWPLRLNLPPPEAVNSDALPWLVQAPVIGGEDAVERVIIGGGWDNPAAPGTVFPGAWLFWPISPLVWGWITSPLVPTVPLAGEGTDGPDETDLAAPAQPTGAANDPYGVDASWAGALLAAGLLAVPKADAERTRQTVRVTPRRGGPDAGR
jgi:hypothetical protein